MILRPLKDIFREFEVFDYKCDAFSDIFREIEVLKSNMWLFQRLQGFLKTFLIELRLF
jgi:hypothetical protein